MESSRMPSRDERGISGALHLYAELRSREIAAQASPTRVCRNVEEI